MLYERALQAYCLVLDLWMSYIQYTVCQPYFTRLSFSELNLYFILVIHIIIHGFCFDGQERVLGNVHDIIVSIHRRAVRNYPWSGLLWASYIRALVNTNPCMYLLFQYSC